MWPPSARCRPGQRRQQGDHVQLVRSGPGASHARPRRVAASFDLEEPHDRAADLDALLEEPHDRVADLDVDREEPHDRAADLDVDPEEPHERVADLDVDREEPHERVADLDADLEVVASPRSPRSFCLEHRGKRFDVVKPLASRLSARVEGPSVLEETLAALVEQRCKRFDVVKPLASRPSARVERRSELEETLSALAEQ